MKILIDMDGVMEDLIGAWVDWLDVHHNLLVKKEDIVEWEISKFFPSLTEEQIYEPLKHSSFWETVKPINGATEYIKKLMEDGHKVYVVTASSIATINMKWQIVIKKYFPYLSTEQLIIAKDKHMINGDILIDDNPENFSDDIFGILFPQPHNLNYRIPEHKGWSIMSVNNWKEIYNLIPKI